MLYPIVGIKESNIKHEIIFSINFEEESSFLYLYLAEIKDKVILIDEPESSLHPAWQSRILKLYENYAQYEVYIKVLLGHSVESNITFATYGGKKFNTTQKIKMIESIRYDI